MKRVNDQEFAAVTALPASQRDEHFIKQVADLQEVWSLRGAAGWVVAGDSQGRECVPVWPHSRYAQACAQGKWEGTEPASIPLDRWLEAWTPGIIRDGRAVAAFLTASDQGVVVSAERLRDDVQEELNRYA